MPKKDKEYKESDNEFYEEDDENDGENDDDNEDNNIVEELEEEIEIFHKKRGPKKKKIRVRTNSSFRLNDSDIDSDTVR